MPVLLPAVPLRALSWIKYEWDIHVFVTLNRLFSFVFFLRKWFAHFLLIWNDVEWVKHFMSEENYDIFHIWNGGSLEITLTASISFDVYTGCPKKHGNSVTNLISSLLWISIVIPNFKSHHIIMSDRVYFMKRVKDCKDVSVMSPQDEQWRQTSLLCLYTVIFLFYWVQPYAVKT